MGDHLGMKEIGIRELKAHASDLVNKVAEHQETYTITRRGRAVGILAPTGFLSPAAFETHGKAWERLMQLADRLTQESPKGKSAVRELERMRR
jgi:prevent-host-death family protein